MAAEEIVFHDEAASEYDAAFDWYLARSPDAARRFDDQVEIGLQEILQNPGQTALSLPADTCLENSLSL